jgi:hypothetical protein
VVGNGLETFLLGDNAAAKRSSAAEEVHMAGSNPTTLAIGEEDPKPTTKALGEEDPPVTTLAIGEEDPKPTTKAKGEEDPPLTTLAIGEEDDGDKQKAHPRGEQASGNPFGSF